MKNDPPGALGIPETFSFSHAALVVNRTGRKRFCRANRRSFIQTNDLVILLARVATKKAYVLASTIVGWVDADVLERVK